MKDASYALRVGYFALLDSALSVPVYDAKADNLASGNYVIISEQTNSTDSSKDSFQYEHTITIDVVTRFTGNAATSKTADDIANAISQAVQPTPSTCGLTVTGFNILTTNRDSKDLKAQFGTEYIIRKLLTFSHLITTA